MKSLKILPLCFLIVLICNRCKKNSTLSKNISKKVLVGYLPESYPMTAEKIDFLTDFILFSGQIKKDGSLEIPARLIPKLEAIKNNKPKNTKVFICIGGWGRSKNFPLIAGDETLRKTFIKNVVDFLKKYKLDGVDYDWEHPKNKTEAADYGKLIRETNKADVLVSVASAGYQKFEKKTFEALYRVNLMSYDGKGKHSTLEAARENIQRYLKKGCRPEKIALGVPFYGRHIKTRKAKTFKKLSQKINNDTVNEIDGYYFNNIAMLKKKVDVVKKLNLAGIMIWQIEQDTEDSRLLKSLSKELGK